MEITEMLRTKKRRLSITISLGILLLIGAFFIARALLWNRNDGGMELLSLVNAANPLEEECLPPLEEIRGVQVDSRCAEDLAAMLSACEEAGYKPLLTEGYISRQRQQEKYERSVKWYSDNGSSEEQAHKLALTEVFFPATDEHELGLAVDIVDAEYRTADVRQGETATQRWLMENCHNYGFVLRYEEGKEDMTGRAFSPWHYRYVGREAAEQMKLLELSLEEYLMWFFSEEAIVIYS